MKRFLPFFTLLFLVSLIGIATYKISGEKDIRDSKNLTDLGESDIKFSKVSIHLPEFSLPDLFDENKDFSKKDLTGKYSIVNFFASWCTTCHAEHEILLRLQSENIADIYGIAWRDVDNNTKKFLKNNGNPYKKVAKDSRGLFNRITGIRAIPETLIIDPYGNVVMRYRGNLQDFSVDELREFFAKHQ